jgi:hypothetical protein
MPPKKKSKTEADVAQKKLQVFFNAYQQSNDKATPSEDAHSPSPSTPDADVTASSQIASESEQQSQSAKAREVRHFQKAWIDKYPWLKYQEENDLMFCKLCREAGKSNAMAVGTNNYKTSTLTRHVDSSDHKMLAEGPKEATNLKKASTKMLDRKEKTIEVALKAMFWLCKEGLPQSKFRSLMKFLSSVGVEVPSLKHGDNPEGIVVDYTSDTSADDFLEILSDMIDESTTAAVKKSPVITVFVDESTDIVVHHKLAINLRVVDPMTLQPRTFFLTDVRITSATGAGMFDVIGSEFKKRGLEMSKVFGLGTDGASAMVGKKTGLTGHFLELNPSMRNTHCSAHRVALVAEQAADRVDAVKTFRETITSIYYYFHRSPAKVDSLEKVQKILEEPVVKFKEVHAIRWLSFFLAIETVVKALHSLLTYLQSRNPQQDPKAQGLLKKVAQEQFIRILYGMMDWLQPIMALSQFFQQKDIDISLVKVNVQTCIKELEDMRDDVNELGKPRYSDALSKDMTDGSYMGHKVQKNASGFQNVKRSFLQGVVDNLKRRFPDSETISMFSIFGMRPLQFLSDQALQSWGNEEMKTLAEFYTSPQCHTGTDDFVYVSKPFLQCEPADLMEEWMRCKSIVKANHYPVHSLTALWQFLASLQKDGFLKCPNLIQLCHLVLTHPVHSCDCERTFSTQNITVTPLRNRLKSEKTDQLMRVKLEGGDLEEFDFHAAVKKWREKKCRAIFGHK